VLAIREHLVATAEGALGQDDRARDDPVGIAVPNEPFLDVLVVVGTTQKQPKPESLRTAEPGAAVTGTKAGLDTVGRPTPGLIRAFVPVPD